MRFPFLPTLLVTASVAAMANLGFWQLDRKQQKQALIAQYRANAALPPIAWPAVPPADGSLLYRRATGFCLEPAGWRAAAGRNAAGETGWIHIAACRTGAERPAMQVNMGWSRSGTAPVGWRGGRVSGVIVPDRLHQIRLDSAVPAPGLQAAARPAAPSPGNHLSYAIQWFFLAAAAAVIYGLALRRRLRP
ncbi:MAG TPA: SURF1 family cytochrome oxidase biogenesis protein [Allosphingosinicella sp.]|nr:SURF1 family cytochrome oxidase biogenesis protein [Allosphingosinicella sp.]